MPCRRAAWLRSPISCAVGVGGPNGSKRPISDCRVVAISQPARPVGSISARCSPCRNSRTSARRLLNSGVVTSGPGRVVGGLSVAASGRHAPGFGVRRRHCQQRQRCRKGEIGDAAGQHRRQKRFLGNAGQQRQQRHLEGAKPAGGVRHQAGAKGHKKGRQQHGEGRRRLWPGSAATAPARRRRYQAPRRPESAAWSRGLASRKPARVRGGAVPPAPKAPPPAPVPRTVAATSRRPGAPASGKTSSASAVTKAQPIRNETATVAVSRAACHSVMPGSIRQRTSAPVIRPKPKVCEIAIAAMPERLAAPAPTPVPRWRAEPDRNAPPPRNRPPSPPAPPAIAQR